MRKGIAATATATTPTFIPSKFSVQPVTHKALIPLLIHYGTAIAITKLAKNATASEKH